MTDTFTPVMRALVVATLLMASATVMLVAMSRAYAVGALAIGACGAYGHAHDYDTAEEARASAQATCKGKACRVVTTLKGGCAAFAVDFVNPCGGDGWGQDGKLGNAQNVALRACYKDGGKECVIRTFFCDGAR